MPGFPWHRVLSCMSSMVAAIFFCATAGMNRFGGEEKQKKDSVRMQA